MAFADFRVFGTDLGHEFVDQLFADQRLRDADRARGIFHPHRRRLVVGLDFQRRVRARGRRAADQQRYVKLLALHFLGEMAHFLERRCDQARQADHVGAFRLRRVENLLRRYHDTEIDHVEVVAAEHDADDVLANVVHIALDRGHDDLAIGFGDIAGATFLPR